jgi:hypothetical protein
MAIYDENGVPILRLSAKSQAYLDDLHQSYIDADADGTPDHFLTAESVVVHNPAPVGNVAGDTSAPDYTFFSIGASDMDEALKDVIGAFDTHHVRENDRVNTPQWVASTNEDVARLLAEHYNGGKADGPCRVIPISEVL